MKPRVAGMPFRSFARALVATALLLAPPVRALEVATAHPHAAPVRHPRVVIAPGPAAPARPGTPTEGDLQSGGGSPPIYTFGDITLRPARVYLDNALEPLVDRLLVLPTPGTQLAGDFVSVFLTDGQTLGPPLPPQVDGSYSYLPFGEDDWKFDQVNAYFLAQNFINKYFAARGWDFGNGLVTGIRIQTTPSSGIIGQYQGGWVDLWPALINGDARHTAKDGDIVRHEMTHAMLIPSFPYPRNGDPFEYWGIHEGMADYYAALAGGNGIIAEYIVPGSGMRPGDITNSSVSVYNMSHKDILQANSYEYGRVVTGALFAIRQTIGPIMEDLITTLQGYATPAGFHEFADGIRRADIERYGGAHLALIDAAFSARGIDPGSNAVVVPFGPTRVSDQDSYTYSAEVSGGYGPFAFQWSASADSGAHWSPVATGSAVDVSFGASCYLKCDVTDQIGHVYSSGPVGITVFHGPVPPPLTHAEISGPTTLHYGETGHYTLTTDAPFVSPATWDMRGGIGGPPKHVDQDEVDVTGLSNFTLVANVTGAGGGTARALLRVVVGPSVAVTEQLTSDGAAVQAIEGAREPLSTVAIGSVHSRADGVVRMTLAPGLRAGSWQVGVFDVNGRRVSGSHGAVTSGTFEIWDPASASPGIYFVELTTPGVTRSFRLVLLP